MRLRNRLLFLSLLFSCSLAAPFFAAAFDSFRGRITSDGINVRSDATVNSKVICTLNRGDHVEVAAELYDWYKIVLPKRCPSFIRKDFIMLIDDKSGRVLKDNVNVRLAPNEGAPIAGKTKKDEVVNVIGESGNWYRIYPLNHCYAWINKRFVEKIVETNKNFGSPASSASSPALQTKGESVFVGTIEPYGKVAKRQATHKLVSADKVYLLKGNAENLNSLTYHTVRVTGKVIADKKDKFPVIEISKMEILN